MSGTVCITYKNGNQEHHIYNDVAEAYHEKKKIKHDRDLMKTIREIYVKEG